MSDQDKYSDIQVQYNRARDAVVKLREAMLSFPRERMNYQQRENADSLLGVASRVLEESQMWFTTAVGVGKGK